MSLTLVARKVPLEFDGAFSFQTKAKATYFLQLMKALVRSGVIAKTPLKNASDIRALYGAKVEIEAKGFHGTDLVGLLVATHRLWTPGRMGCSFRKSVRLVPLPTRSHGWCRFQLGLT